MDRFFKSNGLSKGPSIQGFTGGGGVWMGWLVFCWLFFAIKKNTGYTPKIAGFHLFTEFLIDLDRTLRVGEIRDELSQTNLLVFPRLIWSHLYTKHTIFV